MKVNRVYSPDIYRKIMLAEQDKKDDIYRYDMMMPFKGKQDVYHIPMTPKYPGGYNMEDYYRIKDAEKKTDE